MQQAIDGSIKATTQDIYILMNEIAKRKWIHFQENLKTFQQP